MIPTPGGVSGTAPDAAAWSVPERPAQARGPQHAVFGRTDRVIEGWYWALPSRDLPRRGVRPLRLLGRDLVLYRGDDGGVRCLDAYCPHMGAHLAEGKVEGTGLRCFFHGWKFDTSGACVDIPCQDRPVPARVRSWPVAERYGLLWVWCGPEARGPVPYVPELRDCDVTARRGGGFVKPCHPAVVMINAIDAQHFNTVHHLPVRLQMDDHPVDESGILFSNSTRVPVTAWWKRLIARFYAGPLTYSLCYWFATNGTVTLGPDRVHFHILFALRPNDDGATEGQTLLLTRRRSGPVGWALDRVLLGLTWAVGQYFARGDTRVFRTIRFSLRTPIPADAAILRFVQHADQQSAVAWGTWEPLAPAASRRLEVVPG